MATLAVVFLAACDSRAGTFPTTNPASATVHFDGDVYTFSPGEWICASADSVDSLPFSTIDRGDKSAPSVFFNVQLHPEEWYPLDYKGYASFELDGITWETGDLLSEAKLRVATIEREGREVASGQIQATLQQADDATAPLKELVVRWDC